MTEASGQPSGEWVAIVLCAGRGARMRSQLPKVLHTVAGRPMVHLVLDSLEAAGFANAVVVTAAADDAVAESVRERAAVAVQGEPLGTGHAVLAARDAAGGASRVLVLYGDLPLLTPRTLTELSSRHDDSGAVLTFLSAYLDDPTGYGRILREDGQVGGIVEESETDERTRRIHEVNAGLYATEARWLWPTLEGIKPGPRGEIYLTDIIGAAVASTERLQAYQITESSEVQQVNTRTELALAERAMRERIRARLMADGVTLTDPDTTYVDALVRVGPDTTLLPGVHLLGDTEVGAGCRIGPNAILRDTVTGDGCTVGGSTIEGARLADRVSVGPYCHVRPGTELQHDVHLGNYAEIKASRVGARTRIGHFSYVGDADVGADVNIGAGTVTANYDGNSKHRTRIGDGAFIGSDSMLIAPVTIGAGARTAAGSIVTKDVPPNASAVGAPARIRRDRPPREEA